MNTVTTDQVLVSRPKITLMMLMCGIVSAACVGAVSAATPEDNGLSVTVHYDTQSLDTDSGARALYRRLLNAAAAVCPQDASSPHWISNAVRQCREQSLARAVFKVNSPKLVQVYNISSKNG